MISSPKLIVLATSLVALAPAAETIERLDPALDAIIPPDTEIETLCTGFQWAEGPVWLPEEKRLLFSDVPRNTIYTWKEGMTEAEVWMKPSGFTGPVSNRREPGSNGLALDAKGQLVLCEHGDRRVAVLTEDGGKMTIADQYEGKRFNSPNDLAIHSSGAIYFTDPPYGLPKDAKPELDFCGVFRVTPDGEVTLLDRSLDRPNGIALSPDEKTLYVAQSHGPRPIITAYPMKDDGTVGPGEVFFDCKPLDGPGAPDGLKVGPDGTVFSTGPGGLLIISKEGKLLGRVLCGRATANVGFGNDGRWLFLTSKDRILRLRLKE
ncbi:gluconolactonase [Haloferula helveola]|uniref:Gluconolactonase n=1 Tax=Haloferula helveola TaxID=490095 RepID=A0ABN6H9K3_9BACT|nr:gluconolactonase [Haloferula helveola]